MKVHTRIQMKTLTIGPCVLPKGVFARIREIGMSLLLIATWLVKHSHGLFSGCTCSATRLVLFVVLFASVHPEAVAQDQTIFIECNIKTDNDELLTIYRDGHWTYTTHGGNSPFGLCDGNTRSGNNFGCITKFADFPSLKDLNWRIDSWNAEVIGGRAPRCPAVGSGSNSGSTVSVVAHTDEYVQVQFRDSGGCGSQGRVDFTLRLSFKRFYAPAISVQPVAQTSPIGGQATFSVTASGSGTLSYQWLFNGNSIPGAVSSVLSISSARTNEGNYSVTVNSDFGAVTSSAASLKVLEPPIIKLHPVSVRVPSGSFAELFVGVVGRGPFQYQWLFQRQPLANQTNYFLAIAAATLANAGEYSVQVINRDGTASSAPANLSVIIPSIDISGLPDLNAPHGGPTEFYLTCTNLAPPIAFSAQISPFQDVSVGGVLRVTNVSDQFALVSFTPADNDTEQFLLRFFAANSVRTNSSEIEITPISIFPSELDILPPGAAPPEPDSVDYIQRLVTTSSFPFGPHSQPIDVTFAGPILHVETGNPNGIALFDNNGAVPSFTLTGQKISLGTRMRVPGGTVVLSGETITGATNIEGAASIVLNQDLQSWLTPTVARLILLYLEDVYQNGNVEQVRNGLLDLQRQLKILPFVSDEELASELRASAEFAQIRQRIEFLLMQLRSGRDFFGEKMPSVPLLSFEVYLGLYQSEIDPAIRTLWLSYWMRNRIQTLQDKIQALTEMKATKLDETSAMVVELSGVSQSISDLSRHSLLLSNRHSTLLGALEWRKKELEEIAAGAEEEARKQKKKNAWRRIVNTIGFVMQQIPIFQPALGEIGSGLRFVAQVGGQGQVDFTGDFNQVLQTIQNPLFQNGISQLVSVGTNLVDLANNPNADLSQLLRAVSSGLTNIPTGVAGIQQAWKDSSSRVDDLRKQVAEAKDAAPELNSAVTTDLGTWGILDQMDATIVEMAQVGDQIAQATAQAGKLHDGITENTIAVDAINKDLVDINDRLNPRVWIHVKQMEQRAKNRLDYYFRKVVRAFEARFGQPYSGPRYIEALFSKMAEIAAGPHTGKETLSQQEFSSLRGVYDDVLSDIVQQVVSGVSLRSQRQGSYRFSAQDLDNFNAGGVLALNLMQAGAIDPSMESVVLARLEVSMDVFNRSHRANSRVTVVGYSSEENIYRRGTNFFVFYNDAENGNYWASTYFSNDGRIVPDQPSAAQDSLLRYLLRLRGIDTPTNIELFHQTAAWTPIYFEKQVFGAFPLDLIVTNLTINYTLEFSQAPRQYAILQIGVTPPSLRPTFLLDRKDVRGRQNAAGPGCWRLFPSTVKNVTVTFQGKGFREWRDGYGLPILDVPATNRSITIDPSKHPSIQAIVVSDDSDEDGIPDWFESEVAGTLAFGPADDPNGTGKNLLAQFLEFAPGFPKSALAKQADGFYLEIYTERGKRFRIEKSDDLQNWNLLQEFNGTDSAIPVIDPERRPKVFYRLKTLAEPQ